MFLTHAAWPGNVRELENAIERSVVIGREDYIQPQDLLISKDDSSRTDVYKGKSLKDGLTIFKKHFIRQALEDNAWHQTETAKALDIQRTYLSRLIKELEIASNKE